MEFAAILVNILAAFSSAMSSNGEKSAPDVCIAETTRRRHLERPTLGNVSSIFASGFTFHQSQDMERLMKQERIQMTSRDRSVVAFRSCCVQKWLKLGRGHKSNLQDTCIASRHSLFQALNSTLIFHRDLAIFDCEDFPTSDTAPLTEPPGHTHWRHGDNLSNYTTDNELDHACPTEEDAQMSQLATPVIFGCLVLLYAGHLAALMMNIMQGGNCCLGKCPTCVLDCDGNHADTCRHQEMEESSPGDEDDNNDDSCNNYPDYFQYGDNNEIDSKNKYRDVNEETFFDAIDDDFCSVYWDESMSNEVIHTGDEDSVDDDGDEDHDTISDNEYESDDGLNDECDDENWDDSSDQDTNSWQ